MGCCRSKSRTGAKQSVAIPGESKRISKRDQQIVGDMSPIGNAAQIRPSIDGDIPMEIEVIESSKARIEKSHDFLERESGSGKIAIHDSPNAGGNRSLRFMADQNLTSSNDAPTTGHEGERLSRRLKHFSLQRSRTDSNANSSSASLRIRGNRASEDLSGQGRFVFSQFLTKCYSHEVLDYWDATTQYIKLCKKKTAGDNAKEVARKCIAEYVLPGAMQKLDLGESVENPLIAAYENNKYEPDTFDPTRKMLLKLLHGLRMDAIVSLGVKSPSAMAVSAFLEEEERKMHLLMFQRDVHPLLHMMRKNTTYGNNPPSPKGSGIFKKTSQVFGEMFGSQRKGSGSAPIIKSASAGLLPRTSSKIQMDQVKSGLLPRTSSKTQMNEVNSELLPRTSSKTQMNEVNSELLPRTSSKTQMDQNKQAW